MYIFICLFLRSKIFWINLKISILMKSLPDQLKCLYKIIILYLLRFPSWPKKGLFWKWLESPCIKHLDGYWLLRILGHDILYLKGLVWVIDRQLETLAFLYSGTAEQYFQLEGGGLSGGDSMSPWKKLNSIFLRRSWTLPILMITLKSQNTGYINWNNSNTNQLGTHRISDMLIGYLKSN